MSSPKSIARLVLLGLLIIHPGHAQESDDCSYPELREIEGLADALRDHAQWVRKVGWEFPEVPGRANFCNADLIAANLKGANLKRANLKGANLDEANLEGDRVPARGVRALRSTRLPAGRAGTFRLPRWAA